MRMRKLGAMEVSELGFGTLSFASTYGQAPENAENIRVIRGAPNFLMRMLQLLSNRMGRTPSVALAVGDVVCRWSGSVQSIRVVIAHEVISQAYEC